MKEQLISFETAKLAKEKGFDIYTRESFYQFVEEDWFDDPRKGHKTVLHERGDVISTTGYIEVEHIKWRRPTQSLLQKWLREKFDIDVYVIPNGMRDKSISKRLYHPMIWFKDEYQSELHPKYSYEEALEKGLQEALILLPNLN